MPSVSVQATTSPMNQTNEEVCTFVWVGPADDELSAEVVAPNEGRAVLWPASLPVPQPGDRVDLDFFGGLLRKR